MKVVPAESNGSEGPVAVFELVRAVECEFEPSGESFQSTEEVVEVGGRRRALTVSGKPKESVNPKSL